jgi:hypothetical protein
MSPNVNTKSNIQVSKNEKLFTDIVITPKKKKECSIKHLAQTTQESACDPFEEYFAAFKNTDKEVIYNAGFPTLETFQPAENVIASNNTQLLLFDDMPTTKIEDDLTKQVEEKDAEEKSTDKIQMKENEDKVITPSNNFSEKALYHITLADSILRIQEIDKNTDLYDNIKTYKCIFKLSKDDKWLEYNVFLCVPGFTLSKYLHSHFSSLLRKEKYVSKKPDTFYTISYNDDKVKFTKSNCISGNLSFYFQEHEDGFKFVKNPVESKPLYDVSSKQNDDTGKKEKRPMNFNMSDMKKVASNLSDSKFLKTDIYAQKCK